MQRLLPLLFLLLGLALAACRAHPDAPEGPAGEPAARPEVRYYMIADA